MMINTKQKKKFVTIAIVLLLLLLITTAWYVLVKRSHSTNQQKSPTIKTQNGGRATSDQNVPSETHVATPGTSSIIPTGKDETSTTSNIDSNTTPSAPIGAFVSNHKPNLGGTPTPNSIVSSCTTTPGAWCKISFSKAGVVKSLPSQQTDSNGNTTWNWTLQNLGLSEGSWKITATAINGSLSSSSSDAMDMAVQP